MYIEYFSYSIISNLFFSINILNNSNLNLKKSKLINLTKSLINYVKVSNRKVDLKDR